MNSANSTDSASALRPWHFFVILTLLAATVAVLMSRRTSPEALVMLSVTIFAAGVSALAVFRMLLPLVGHERLFQRDTVGHRTRVLIEREKQLVLRSIKELEFDRAMGKVSVEDFDEQVKRLRARAVGLMRQLDEQHVAPIERIEQELRERLARDAQSERKKPKEPRQMRASVACVLCGVGNEEDARFCKACGTRLAGAHA